MVTMPRARRASSRAREVLELEPSIVDSADAKVPLAVAAPARALAGERDVVARFDHASFRLPMLTKIRFMTLLLAVDVGKPRRLSDRRDRANRRWQSCCCAFTTLRAGACFWVSAMCAISRSVNCVRASRMCHKRHGSSRAPWRAICKTACPMRLRSKCAMPSMLPKASLSTISNTGSMRRWPRGNELLGRSAPAFGHRTRDYQARGPLYL